MKIVIIWTLIFAIQAYYYYIFINIFILSLTKVIMCVY